MLFAQIAYAAVMACQLIFLFYDFPKETAFWIYAGIAGIGIPAGVAQASAMLPMFMRIFPAERFGQFCAANAMSGALATIVGGMLAGVFLDFLKGRYGGSDYYYRFVPAWTAFFIGLTAVVTCFILKEWKRLGGDRNFQPPPVHPHAQSSEPPPKS